MIRGLYHIEISGWAVATATTLDRHGQASTCTKIATPSPWSQLSNQTKRHEPHQVAWLAPVYGNGVRTRLLIRVS